MNDETKTEPSLISITLESKQEASFVSPKDQQKNDYDIRLYSDGKDQGLNKESLKNAKKDVVVITAKEDSTQFSVPQTIGIDPNDKPPRIRINGDHPVTVNGKLPRGGGAFILDGKSTQAVNIAKIPDEAPTLDDKGNMTLQINAPDSMTRNITVQRGAQVNIVSPKDGKTLITLSNKDEASAKKSIENYNAYVEKNGKKLSLADAPKGVLKDALAAVRDSGAMKQFAAINYDASPMPSAGISRTIG